MQNAMDIGMGQRKVLITGFRILCNKSIEVLSIKSNKKEKN
jgi:hypothetical protein